jgi:hypothetical protein
VINVAAPDKPLVLIIRPDGSLDPGTGSYQVHGRIVTGEDANSNFTFAPMERACNLAPLTPAKEIPAAEGAAALAAPSLGLSTPQKPLGNATLSIVSGLNGAPNPLANHPYVLLRDSYANALAKGGVAVPPQASPYAYVGQLCAPQPRTPGCQSAVAAINSSAASAVRADPAGNGTFPGVPPGDYHLMISAQVNGQPMMWSQPVTLHAGANSLTLTVANSQPMK